MIDGAARRIYWPFLLAALFVAGTVSLSIHVVMLQVIGIPFPEDHAPAWLKLLNLAGTTSALLAFQIGARAKLGGVVRTTIVSGCILLFIKEGIRGAVMNGVVTTGWVFALAGLLVPLLLCFGIALICAISARWVTTRATLVVAGFVAGVLAFALQAVIGLAISPVMAALSHLARPDLYSLPYPITVLVPAYLTFGEPVLGCSVLVALMWSRIKGGLFARLAHVALLVVLLKGVLIRTVVYPAYMDNTYSEGMLSQTQFLLEFAALGILTGLAWWRFGADRP